MSSRHSGFRPQGDAEMNKDISPDMTLTQNIVTGECKPRTLIEAFAECRTLVECTGCFRSQGTISHVHNSSRMQPITAKFIKWVYFIYQISWSSALYMARNCHFAKVLKILISTNEVKFASIHYNHCKTTFFTN